MHDLVIRGGIVVDGTGGEPFAADLAIDRGVITAIGSGLPAGRGEKRGREPFPGDVGAGAGWRAGGAAWHKEDPVLARSARFITESRPRARASRREADSVRRQGD